MSNNKQSSVEWYIEKILDLDYEYAKGLITLGVWSERKNALIEQAKALHKEETKNAYWAGIDDRFPLDKDWVKQCAEKYYNKTYGGNK